MSVDAPVETLEFQAEVKQLLRLMIHSLYSNREIFLRELVSNASDACDKLRFEALGDAGLYESDPALQIEVLFDKDTKTLTVRDNGIGMSREEVIENVGTIARSGTKAFLEALEQDKAKDAALIGQFGVGFYSSFIVAERVELLTRRAGLTAGHGVRWVSDGSGQYTLETIERAARGTEVILHLKDDASEFLDGWRLRQIIRRYSDHITLPVMMRSESEEGGETERVNSASALWARAKSEISDEEYAEFYKHVAHDWEAPLAWTHNRVEGRNEYTSLLFIPARAPFDLWDRDRMHGVKLYVKRVFIMDDAEKLMPRYLRFVRGVIDSNDLPLNVSREILQSSAVIDSIRAGSVKKILGQLEQMAENEAEKYATFWKEFGQVLKEGPAEDFANREQIARLLRFASTQDSAAGPVVSLKAYLERMQEGQDAIYYIIADTLAAALNSPHLEAFRKKGMEVLLLSDRVDEWLVSHLREFEGKPLKSVTRADVKLDDEDKHPEAEQAGDLIERFKTALGESVSDVRISTRLVDSPSCVVTDEHDMSLHLQRLLKEAGQSAPAVRPILELNVSHPLVARLKSIEDDAGFSDWARLLLEQAILAEGGALDDAAGFVRRLNRLMS
ncbi:MAG: molecular chaperone HtpG [Halothiobacillaceae bacterium]|jgi:molecular chaperone HtpG|nr:molecular chaperone HtpG [Halothiobacillaceae bacterium]